jgi:hypothetical protein
VAKQSGLGARLYVTGVDLSGDTASVATGSPRAVRDRTGIDKSAMERIYLRRDGSISYGAHWNPAGAHVVLSALPTADQPVTYAHRPTIGVPAASMVGKQINYDGTEAADGGLDFAVNALANGFGLEWGVMLTAGDDLLASAGAITGHDFGAAVGTTAFGLQAYLHVLDIDSGTATVAVQHSNDGGTDPWANVTGAVFAGATAGATAQRLQTDRDESVKRWLRVNVTGTFTNLTLAVMAVKNRAEVLF